MPRSGGTRAPAAPLRPTTGIDAWLPIFDVGERHELQVALSPAEALKIALAAPAAPDAFVRTLFRLRGLKPHGSIVTFMAVNGFTVLERTPTTLVVGLVVPQVRRPPRDPAAWWAAAPRNSLRIAADIRAEPDGAGSRLITETRVSAIERRARLGFRLYWLVVGPFSKLIRRRWLRTWAAAAAGRPGSPTAGRPPVTRDLVLRDVVPGDLPVFFAFQGDPSANHMAAFTAKDPADRVAFRAHWDRILADPTVIMKTVVVAGKVAGSVGKFDMLEKPQVTYWVDREFWGRGIATAALAQFLALYRVRPVYASAAADNPGSLRVLEKCGFVRQGMEKSFANARGQEIDEVFLVLERAQAGEEPRNAQH